MWGTVRAIGITTVIAASAYLCGATSAVRGYIVPSTSYQFESIKSKVSDMSVDELRASRRKAKVLHAKIQERYIATMKSEVEELRSDDPGTLDQILDNDGKSLVRR
jgi:hypothetical protein